MTKIFLTALIGAVITNLTALGADDFIRGIKVSQKGILKLDGITMYVAHYGANWKGYANQKYQAFTVDNGYPEKNVDQITVKGALYPAKSSEAFMFTEILTRVSQDSLSYFAELKSAKGIPTQTLSFDIALPVDKFKGKILSIGRRKLLLPEQKGRGSLFYGKGNLLKIPMDKGNLSFSGTLNVAVSDCRSWGGKLFIIRIIFTPSKGNLKKSLIKLNITNKAFSVKTVDISAAVNMGFQDKTGGDCKGGWTDQGGNDLRMLPTGTINLAGVKFNIIEPQLNKQKSCMVFAGPSREYLLKTATIDISKQNFDYLYLLHAIAWHPGKKLPIGRIYVKYADGDTQVIEPRAGIDVSDWWNPFNVVNGHVVWTGENKDAVVGLYLSRFKVKNKTIKKLKFCSTGKAVWMVVAVSGGEKIPAPTETPSFIVAGKNWQPIKNNIDIKPGSILDFSSFNDAPAGKYGALVVKNGHFEFASRPGVRIKFYGTNLSGKANFLDKKSCEKLAVNLSRMGYNAVRLHFLDHILTSGTDVEKSTVINQQKMDQLDYLFYCLKKNGIYIFTDLYCFRQIKKGEIADTDRAFSWEFKALVPVLDAALDNWKEFAENFLTHKNPYTGLRWADDPALAGLSLLNEDSVYMNWAMDHGVKKLYYQKFNQYLKTENIIIKDETERSAAFSEFMLKRQIRAYSKMMAFLKNKLGVKALLSGVNCRNKTSLVTLRNKFDYVDNHCYWDTPVFIERKWRLPYGLRNSSVLRSGIEVPRLIMGSRIFGKPYTVTEFNFVRPNHFRAEMGPLMGAFAALQDWDALFNYTFSHTPDFSFPGEGTEFNTGCDPLRLLTERIAILMFRRGDVETTRKMITYYVSSLAAKVPEGYAWETLKYPANFTKAGLYCRIGSVLGKKETSLTKNSTDLIRSLAERENISSSTKQLFTNLKEGTFKALTAKSECFVLPKGSLQGKVTQVSDVNDFMVIFLTAIDDKKLSESKRILVLCLTDVQNSRIKFRSEKHKILMSWGGMPQLVRRGEAKISIANDKLKNAKVWALKNDGVRIGKIPVSFKDGIMAFKAETISPLGQVMAYEISMD